MQQTAVFMRWIGRIALLALGAFFILLGFSHSPYFGRWVRHVIQRYLQQSWGWFVTWRDLRASPLWTSVTLEGLVAGGDPGMPPFLAVERLDLVFRWWRFRQPLDRIEAFSPTLRVVRIAPDRWNVPPLKGGGAWVTPFPALVIHAGRIAGQDPERTWTAELRSVRMAGTTVPMPGGTGYRLQGQIEGTLRWQATTWTPLVLTADVQVDPQMDVAFEVDFRYDAPDGRGWDVHGSGRYHLVTGVWQARADGHFFLPLLAGMEQWTAWEVYAGIPIRDLWERRWTFQVDAASGRPMELKVRLGPDGVVWRVQTDCRVGASESHCQSRLESPTGVPVQAEVGFYNGTHRRWRLVARWDAPWPGVGGRWPERWRRPPRLSGELNLEGTRRAPLPTGGHARWEVIWPTATALWRQAGTLTLPTPDRWVLRLSLDHTDASEVGPPDELVRAEASVDVRAATWRLQATGRDWNERVIREVLEWLPSYRLPTDLTWQPRPWRIEAEGTTDGRRWQARWSVAATPTYGPWLPDVDVQHEGYLRQEGRRITGQARLETSSATGSYQSTWDLAFTGFTGVPVRWTLRGHLREWPVPWPSHQTEAVPPVEVSIAEATLELQGVGTRWGPSVISLRTAPLRYRGSAAGPDRTVGVLEAHIERALAPVWRFYVHIRDGLVTAEAIGQWDERQETLEWTITGQTTVRAWWADTRLQGGDLNWRLQGAGRFDVPRLSGEIYWQDVRWDDRALGDWTLYIRTPRELDYRLRMEGPVLGLRAEARWQGPPAGPARWALRVDLRQDGVSYGPYRWTYDARLHASGDWPLRPDRPVEAVEVRLDRFEWRFEDMSLLTLTQPVGVTLDPDRIRGVEAGAWSGRLGSGRVEGGPDGLVIAHRVRLSDLVAFFPPLTGWTGEVAGSVRLSERWRTDVPEWTLSIASLQGPHGYTMDTCTLRGRWTAGVPEGGPCRLIRVNEVWELEADGRRVRLRLQNGEPGTWLTWWQPEVLLPPGRLNLTWVYTHQPEPRWILEVQTLELTYAATVLSLSAPLRVSWTLDRLATDLTPLTVNGQAIRLQVEVAPTGEKSPSEWLRPQAWRDWAVRATWEGPLDLAFMRPWFGWPIAGTLRGSFQASGPLAHPLVIGEIRMDDGEWYLPEWGLRFYPVRLQAQVRGLEDVRGVLESAGLRGHWRLEWQGGWQVDRQRWVWPLARWTAEDLLILGTGGWYLSLSGRLDLDTRPTPWVLRGEIRVPEGVFTLPIRLPMLLARSRPLPETPARPVAVPLDLDVRLQVDRWDIQNNLAVVRSAGQWTVRGPVTAPVVDGEWAAQPGGRLTFQQRTYYLTQARLLWIHAAPWEPQIEFQMETTVPPSETTREPYRIQVGITGTLTEPTVRLVSDPPLPETEILALVTGGGVVPVPREKVLAGEADTSTSIRAVGQAMVMSLGGQAAAGLLRPVTRLLGIEAITVGVPVADVQSVQSLTGGTEFDPTARITVQQAFFPWLNTLFSIDARNTSRQTWIVSAQPWTWFQLRLARNDDASWVLGALPQFVYPRSATPGWAADRVPTKVTRAIITEVQVSGDGPWSGPQMEKLLGVRPGHALDVVRIQERVRRLEAALQQTGHWGAQVLWFLVPQSGVESAYRLHVQVRRGPRFEWVRRGWPPDVTSPPLARWAYPCWQGHTLVVWGQACMEAALAAWARFEGWDPPPVRVQVREAADRWVVETRWTDTSERRTPVLRWTWQVVDGEG
ncbi:MAG: translocation/assembly module TamB, partial [Acidobacteria bacterium]|nr:translocation/assembly module TamB [Acidobacteriota bacterium]